MASDESFKVIVLGDPNVGKTSLILQFVDGVFNEENVENIDRKNKIVELGGKKVKLQITDTAGQERFRTLTSSYFRNADAIIIVYDVNEPDSFKEVVGWSEEAIKYSSDSLQFLVGNKSDLDKKVTSEQANTIMEEHKMKSFIETSAKTGENVQKLFETVAQKLLDNFAGGDASEPTTTEKKPDAPLNLNSKPDPKASKKKGKCVI